MLHGRLRGKRGTWGISGPDFLRLCGVLALAALVVVWVLRRRLLAGDGTDRPVAGLSPCEVAYLADGPTRTIGASEQRG